MLRTGTLLLAGVFLLGVINLMPQLKAALDMVPVTLAGEKPHRINVARFEVTVAEWKACAKAGACEDLRGATGAPEATPMSGVNALDVATYVAWISGETGRKLRLPTADEWRAFSGFKPKAPQAPLFTDPRLVWAANYGQEDAPRGPVKPQGFWQRNGAGIADLKGNVWEWTSSCSFGDRGDSDISHCPAFHAMGAHDAVVPIFIRNPASGGCATGTPPTHLGFRLVEDVE